MKSSQLILLLCALIIGTCATSCSHVVIPGVEYIQSYISAYHVKVEVAAPGSVIASSRAVALTGEAAATFAITAPLLDGQRRVVLKRSVAAGEFGAWTIRLSRDSDASDWIVVQRVSCSAVREDLPEIECPVQKAGFMSNPAPDKVRRRIKL